MQAASIEHIHIAARPAPIARTPAARASTPRLRLARIQQNP